jgi:hypothetical protein
MTEDEWLIATDPIAMLESLEGKASDRKLRLFACACCRRLWPLLTDSRSRRSVEVAEQFADGTASEEALRQAVAEAERVWKDCVRKDELDELVVYATTFVVTTPRFNDANLPYLGARMAAMDTAGEAVAIVHLKGGGKLDSDVAPISEAATQERDAQARLLRDIFGNPSRPAILRPDWLTPAIGRLARTIYDDRAFDRMSQLADALEEDRCDNADILVHCRQPGEHVRGCWALDLILGKE